jgi:DNA-binding MarR family transcriptional regulator
MNIAFSKVPEMEPREFSFGALLVIAIKLDTQLDKVLKVHGLTAKQWFLLVILNTMFETPPTLNQLAVEMGSSYQNVKQMAMKLQAKGLLSITRDPKDARALRLYPSPASNALWETMTPDANRFMSNFYDGITTEETTVLKHTLHRILLNLIHMEDQNKENL